jgi:hypothetical protein
MNRILESSVTEETIRKKESRLKDQKLKILELQKELADIEDKDSNQYASKSDSLDTNKKKLQKIEEELRLDKEILNLKKEIDGETDGEKKTTLRDKIKSLGEKKKAIQDKFKQSTESVVKGADKALSTFLSESRFTESVCKLLSETRNEFIRFKESISVNTEDGEIQIYESEDGTIIAEPSFAEPTTHDDVVELLESYKLLESYTKKDLAEIYTTNNVKGTVVKESDISDKMLSDFNKTISKFSKNFDPKGDDYTGKETDAFIELLISLMGSKDLLFENATELMDEENIEANIEEISERMKESQLMSNRVNGYQKFRLKECIGSRMKIGTPHRRMVESGKAKLIESIMTPATNTRL